MFSWSTIAKFLFLWILAVLIKEHNEFMEKKKRYWPFRQHTPAA